MFGGEINIKTVQSGKDGKREMGRQRNTWVAWPVRSKNIN